MTWDYTDLRFALNTRLPLKDLHPSPQRHQRLLLLQSPQRPGVVASGRALNSNEERSAQSGDSPTSFINSQARPRSFRADSRRCELRGTSEKTILRRRRQMVGFALDQRKRGMMSATDGLKSCSTTLSKDRHRTTLVISKIVIHIQHRLDFVLSFLGGAELVGIGQLIRIEFNRLLWRQVVDFFCCYSHRVRIRSVTGS